MTFDDAVKIINATANLLAVLVWPLLILFIVFRFREAIKQILDSLNKLSVKAAGVEVLAEKHTQTTATLSAMLATDTHEKTSPQQAAEAATKVVSDVLTSSAVKRASRTKILWVDDRPDNNIAAQELLQDLGIIIRTAKSTEEAMEQLASERFNLVISDMGRPPDERAGYTLLSQMKAAAIKLPLIFYAAGGNIPKHRNDAKARGAFDSTNSVTELFQFVFRAIQTINTL